MKIGTYFIPFAIVTSTIGGLPAAGFWTEDKNTRHAEALPVGSHHTDHPVENHDTTHVGQYIRIGVSGTMSTPLGYSSSSPAINWAVADPFSPRKV